MQYEHPVQSMFMVMIMIMTYGWDDYGWGPTLDV